MEQLDLPRGKWLEPAAGNGAIIKAINRSDIEWTAWELREAERTALEALLPPERLHIGDFVVAHQQGALDGKRFAVAITNPPYRLSTQFLEACLARAEVVVLLVSLAYLASQARQPFMSTNTPDVYVLPNRPTFVNGASDHAEYGWMVWRQASRTTGQLRILGLTSEAERLGRNLPAHPMSEPGPDWSQEDFSA
jgi:hypothetical protein